MSWVVDTCIIIDVLEADPEFGLRSAGLLQALLPEGLAVSPITFVELAPAFDGNLAEQRRFLDLAGIAHTDAWTVADAEAAHAAWNTYIQARRSREMARRPVADILIGAFASNRHGLITRNPTDFKRWYPALDIREP